MRLFLKSTQTLIDSITVNISKFNISRRKPKNQPFKFWGKLFQLTLRFNSVSILSKVEVLTVFSLQFLTLLVITPAAYAIYNPLSVPNNKFGIHIISPTPEESSPAAEMVNHRGDWGYVTVLIERKDQNRDKWQQFFNDLRRRHLIPLVRLATEPEGEVWKRPVEADAQPWAEFLDSLNWPTKNRYVIVYNEPNHGREWGGQTDPVGYAKVLDQTITALRAKNPDFFVLNGGLDVSAPQKPPDYMDALRFMQQMNQAVPAVFDKLDGWVSHSYPNPNFSGSPQAQGRGTVRSYLWERQVLKSLGVKKDLPIFITETGWLHSEGIKLNLNYLSPETISYYFKQAFTEAWNDPKIVAVTPFLLTYQQPPFDHFSFKKITQQKQGGQVLGTQHPEYHPQYLAIKDTPKTSGRPVQENKAELTQGEIFSTMVAGEEYSVPLTFKNTGQSIWNEYEPIKLVPIQGGESLGLPAAEIPREVKVEPGQEYTFNLRVKAPAQENYTAVFNLFQGDREFDSGRVGFSGQIKMPVVLKIKSALKWKSDFAGDYILKVLGALGESSQQVHLNDKGESGEIEARFLLPDYTFNFTLERPFYKPVTIRQTVNPGLSVLDFGVLEPDLWAALLHPAEFFRLLPFFN